jgi:hypothetical protein
MPYSFAPAEGSKIVPCSLQGGLQRARGTIRTRRMTLTGSTPPHVGLMLWEAVTLENRFSCKNDLNDCLMQDVNSESVSTPNRYKYGTTTSRASEASRACQSVVVTVGYCTRDSEDSLPLVAALSWGPHIFPLVNHLPGPPSSVHRARPGVPVQKKSILYPPQLKKIYPRS